MGQPMKRTPEAPSAARAATLDDLERMRRFVIGAGVAPPEPHPSGEAERREVDRAAAIERYRLDGELGRGATSTVHRAFDTERGVWVALKVLRPAGEGGEARAAEVDRFGRECAVLSLELHPRIVRGLGHGALPTGELYLAMELLTGLTLEQRLRLGPLPADETATLLRQACEALAALHARGMVHRDVKPSNLFLRDGAVDDVVLLDFGLLRAPDAAIQTAPEIYLGTPGYAAPEQVVSPSVGAGADVYALGVVAYRCLTGRLPFPDDGSSAVHRATLYTEPPPFSAHGVSVPAGLERCVLRALDKHPSNRYADAAALREALERAELDSPPSDRTTTEPMGRALRPVDEVVLEEGHLVQRAPLVARELEAARRERRRLENSGQHGALVVAAERMVARAPALVVRVDDLVRLSPWPVDAWPWEAAVTLWVDLDRDLGSAHRARVVHADVARRWVFLGQDGGRLLGWGFRRQPADSADREDATPVAPEHRDLAPGLKSSAADVYALARVVSSLTDTLPAPWAKLQRAALAREPQSRPRAGALAASLEGSTSRRGREHLGAVFTALRASGRARPPGG
ncbi:MAG: serine/threonine-protein kinase [Polyangiaceae bacterium]